MSIKDKMANAKDGLVEAISDSNKSTIILIVGIAFLLGIWGVNALSGGGEKEDEEDVPYIEVEDQETVGGAEVIIEETVPIEPNEGLFKTAWVRKLNDGTNEYMVFEPEGFNDADGQMVHVYIENPKKKLPNRYTADCYYEAEFGENELYLTYAYGEATGDKAGQYSINDKGALKFGDAVYQPKPFDKLVHFSFSYGTGADEGDNFVEREKKKKKDKQENAEATTESTDATEPPGAEE